MHVQSALQTSKGKGDLCLREIHFGWIVVPTSTQTTLIFDTGGCILTESTESSRIIGGKELEMRGRRVRGSDKNRERERDRGKEKEYIKRLTWQIARS